MAHIISRFLYHFAWAGIALAAFLFTLSLVLRKVPAAKKWVSDDVNHMLFLCGLLVSAIIPTREVYDIYVGNNSFVKGVFDILSWWVGSSFWAILYYRIRSMKSSQD